MFCRQCGNNIPDNTSFCPKCGVQISHGNETFILDGAQDMPSGGMSGQPYGKSMNTDNDMQQGMRMNATEKISPLQNMKSGSMPYNNVPYKMDVPAQRKKRSIVPIIIIAVVAVIAIAAGTVFFIYNSPQNRYKRQLAIGNDFLDTEDYDQAIAAFKKAIDIDPKDPEAYIKLADAYIEKGLDDEAELVLNAGYFMTQSKDITKKADDLGYILIGMDGYIPANDRTGSADIEVNDVESGEKTSVPDLVGLYLESASDILESQGLKARVTYSESDEYDNGVVISQDYSPGSQVDKDTEINIVISSGRAEEAFPYEDYVEGYDPGMVFPDFTMTDMNGNPVNLSDYRGKPLYLNFFTTWCPYCFYEIPDMQSVKAKYGDDVTIILVDLAESVELATEYAQEYGIDFPINHLPEWQVGYHSIEGVPESFILDKHGVIVDYWPGMSEYDWMDSTMQAALQVN